LAKGGIKGDFAKSGKWRLPKTLMLIQGIKEYLRVWEEKVIFH
jgi:hypothetical protein